jgi:hypothetical protein
LRGFLGVAWPNINAAPPHDSSDEQQLLTEYSILLILMMQEHYLRYVLDFKPQAVVEGTMCIDVQEDSAGGASVLAWGYGINMMSQ